MKYTIEVTLECHVGYKGKIRNKKGYSKFVEDLRRTRQLGNVDIQKFSFEHDYRVDPPIEYYLGNPIFKVIEHE